MGLIPSLCYLLGTLALLVGLVFSHPSEIVKPKYTYPADYNRTIIRQPGPEEYKCYTGDFYDAINRDICQSTIQMLSDDAESMPGTQTWGHGGRMGAVWQAPASLCKINVNGEWDELPFGGQFRYFSFAVLKRMVLMMMNRCDPQYGGPGMGGYVEVAPKIYVGIFGTTFLHSTQSGPGTDGTAPNIPPWNTTFIEGMGVVPARLIPDEDFETEYTLYLPSTS